MLREEALNHTLENLVWKRLWTCCRTDYVMMTRQAYGNTAMCCSTNRFKSITPPVYIQKVVTTVHVAVHTAGAKLLLTLRFHFSGI